MQPPRFGPEWQLGAQPVRLCAAACAAIAGWSKTMRVLVTWGSKRGGTEGIARMVGTALAEAGHQPVLLPASKARGEDRFDAAVVGGALYGNRWHPAARRFVWRRRAALRRVPVWLFSSGPLDESSDCG
jgi:menaquinone-dependent protoporphyrinogen oxidase